jgi:hypothetical protein
MEFQAYPPPSKVGAKGSALLRVQSVLHSTDSVALPGFLLLAAGTLIVYQHFTEPEDEAFRGSSKHFLVMIFLTMAPLAFLEKKLFSCTDPAALLCKFSPKVMLMFASFLGLRVLMRALVSEFMLGLVFFNFASLVAACVLLPTVFGFRFSRASFWEHRDVFCLVLLALSAAVLTETIDRYLKGTLHLTLSGKGKHLDHSMLSICETSSDYIELLGWMPALWMLCRQDKTSTLDNEVDIPQAQWKATCFFGFLIGFYFSEDLIGACRVAWDFPIATCGHVAHYLLLLDCATFFLAHLYDPKKVPKVMGNFMNFIADACAV